MPLFFLGLITDVTERNRKNFRYRVTASTAPDFRLAPRGGQPGGGRAGCVYRFPQQTICLYRANLEGEIFAFCGSDGKFRSENRSPIRRATDRRTPNEKREYNNVQQEFIDRRINCARRG